MRWCPTDSIIESFGKLPFVNDLAPAVRTLARLARLLERSCADLTLPQYRILAMVSGGDERASHLAERLALAKPTITAVVDGLVERGLVSRSAVDGDRRAARIQVTPDGRRALKAAERTMAERIAAVIDRAPDPAGVVAALAALGRALDAASMERAEALTGGGR